MVAVDDHNRYAKNPGTDPFGKKASIYRSQKAIATDDLQFFSNGDFKMDDLYHVALMVGLAHMFVRLRSKVVLRLPFYTILWAVLKSALIRLSTTLAAKLYLVFLRAVS